MTASSEVDSLVIDPHKHGLQPYGCGCILFRDPAVGALYKHDSPYTYFTSAELHLGEISLECSRAGASAVALWATQRMFPLERGGAFAADLGKCRQAALTLYAKLQADPRFMTAFAPELDIVIFAPQAANESPGDDFAALARNFRCGRRRKSASGAGQFAAKSARARRGRRSTWDQPTVTCLRSCLMKPEHLDWIERIWSALERATDAVRAADH